MAETCPLCDIPHRKEEKLLYEDSEIYLVQTKTMKGHRTRVMVCSKQHSKNPTFQEETKAYSVLINYMQNIMKNEKWFIVEGKYASHPEHYHLVGCDSLGTPEELELLHKTPKVEFPLIKQKSILIGIPAYNTERTIEEIVIKAKRFGEVLVIDDGSKDDTGRIALSAGAEVIRFNKNSGYGNAIIEIFNQAKRRNFDILLTLDADGQHDPSEIPDFIQSIEEADLVIGNRFLKETSIPGYRKAGIKVVSKIEGVGDAQCGFRAYNKHAINSIKITEKGMGASLEIIHKAKQKKLKIKEIPCSILYEDTKHSKNPLSHGSDLVESILWSRIWRRPLTFLGILGIIMSGIGIFSSIQTLILYTAGGQISLSWTILSLGSLLCGLLLLITATIVYLLKRGLEEIK